MPVRTAWITGCCAASQRVAPSAKSASTCSRRPASSSPSRSNESETPFSALPRIMPNSGIAYCGKYHGSACTTPKMATAAISPMLRSFYADRRVVVNDRLRDELGVERAYPTYREGLSAIWAAETGAA